MIRTSENDPKILADNSNVVEFVGHVCRGNTYRSPRVRIEGATVIEAIRNRYHIFVDIVDIEPEDGAHRCAKSVCLQEDVECH